MAYQSSFRSVRPPHLLALRLPRLPPLGTEGDRRLARWQGEVGKLDRRLELHIARGQQMQQHCDTPNRTRQM
eukprot:613477-Pyramimonas_sp.AAC.1